MSKVEVNKEFYNNIMNLVACPSIYFLNHKEEIKREEAKQIINK